MMQYFDEVENVRIRKRIREEYFILPFSYFTPLNPLTNHHPRNKHLGKMNRLVYNEVYFASVGF